MRVALICLTESTDDGARALLGSLPLAGRSLALRQLDFALLLGCEKLICLTRGVTPTALDLQREAEAAGLRCSLVASSRQMLGMVNAADEFLLLADGLVPGNRQAAQLLDHGPAVLALPEASGCPAGFERIDAAHAWAGAALLSGRCVERLAELPGDIDPLSALLRIGLQMRTPLRALPESTLQDGRWVLLRSEAALRVLEPDWLASLLPQPSPGAPARLLALAILKRLAGALVGRHRAIAALSGSAALALLMAVSLAILVNPAAALAVAGGAWLLIEFTRLAAQMLREGRALVPAHARIGAAASLLFDLVAASLVHIALGMAGMVGIFLAALPFLVLRMSRRLPLGRWSGLAQDRLVLCLALALAQVFGGLELVVLGHGALLLLLAAFPKQEKAG